MHAVTTPEISRHFFGHMNYLESLKLQDGFMEAARTHPERVSVLGFEYDPVITLGRRASVESDVNPISHALDSGIQIVKVPRGGQATLHSPGQLVIYPVCNIRFFNQSLKTWVCDLLKITQKTFTDLAPQEAQNLSLKGSGLYLNRGKLASLGLRIDRGISSFGLALNINNDLGLFRSIRPCGVSGQEMAALGQGRTLETVFAIWSEHFDSHFSPRLRVDKTAVLPHFDSSLMRP